jgi:pimeloyl-ACP methyl ester carboxylesterase
MHSQTQHLYIKTNNIRLHVVAAGPKDGPLLICLHGFPEFWRGWQSQILALARAGYRVWIPDQRGYHLSDKPPGIAAYNLDELAADVVGLIDAAGQPKASVVGHDWGGAVAWWTANKYPERLNRLAILNVPQHAVMNRHLRQSWGQLRKSWYIFFFQLPWLPELLIKAGNWRAGVQALRRSSRPGTFTGQDLDRYRQAWSQPGALTAMLNWYRAILQARPEPLSSPRIVVPTLLIWGAQDAFLGREMAQPSIELCRNGRLVFIEEATHWVQHEEPERVNALLIGFLSPG